MQVMQDWERKAAELAEENRQRREQSSPWGWVGLMIAGVVWVAILVSAIF
jgi:hypothetical protein